MNPSTSAGRTRRGGLATTVKKTFRSYATASTVFGRHRPARNSRYSSSGTPSRAISSPAASRDRVRRTTVTGMQALHLHEEQACQPVKISMKITRISCMTERRHFGSSP